MLLGEAYQLRANCFLGFIKFEAIFILGNFFDDEDAQTEGNKEQDFFHVAPFFVNVYFLSLWYPLGYPDDYNFHMLRQMPRVIEAAT